MSIDANAKQKATILRISDLSVNRAGSEVIKDVDLLINEGEFVGIVGPNGGGKTTLILTILGILKPHKGSVLVTHNQSLQSSSRTQVGWVPQAATNIPDHLRITVREFIRLGLLNLRNCILPLSKSDKVKVDTIIETVDLTSYANTRLTRLSGGQRQRAAIGKALASNSDLLLMDEPMVGVDIESRKSILGLLSKLCQEQNKTIVMISHDLASIKKTADRMVYLENTIWFDGLSSEFPELSTLIDLRESNQLESHSTNAISSSTIADDGDKVLQLSEKGGD